jgi:hypothetical protein
MYSNKVMTVRHMLTAASYRIIHKIISAIRLSNRKLNVLRGEVTFAVPPPLADAAGTVYDPEPARNKSLTLETSVAAKCQTNSGGGGY